MRLDEKGTLESLGKDNLFKGIKIKLRNWLARIEIEARSHASIPRKSFIIGITKNGR